MIVQFHGIIFDAKRFVCAETSGSGLHIYLEGTKCYLSVPTKRMSDADALLAELQNLVNSVLSNNENAT